MSVSALSPYHVGKITGKIVEIFENIDKFPKYNDISSYDFKNEFPELHKYSNIYDFKKIRPFITGIIKKLYVANLAEYNLVLINNNKKTDLLNIDSFIKEAEKISTERVGNDIGLLELHKLIHALHYNTEGNNVAKERLFLKILKNAIAHTLLVNTKEYNDAKYLLD